LNIQSKIFNRYKILKAHPPELGRHKIYSDYGNEANRADYRYRQKRMEHILKDGSWCDENAPVT
jgi:hypothetical protein